MNIRWQQKLCLKLIKSGSFNRFSHHPRLPFVAFSRISQTKTSITKKSAINKGKAVILRRLFFLFIAVILPNAQSFAVICALTTLKNEKNDSQIHLLHDLHLENEKILAKKLNYHPYYEKTSAPTQYLEIIKEVSEKQKDTLKEIHNANSNIYFLVENLKFHEDPSKLLTFIKRFIHYDNFFNINTLRISFFTELFKYQDEYLLPGTNAYNALHRCYQNYLDKIAKIKKPTISQKLLEKLEEIKTGVETQRQEAFNYFGNYSTITDIYKTISRFQNTAYKLGIGYGPELEILEKILEKRNSKFIVMTGAIHCDRLIKLLGYEGFEKTNSINMNDQMVKIKDQMARYSDLISVTESDFLTPEQIQNAIMPGCA
ncbi:hypothetical protein KAU11_03385 [Candidatus Babeliales bacterium]|nr:hypothetical protein [Candidatus Babeliales bacterium]